MEKALEDVWKRSKTIEPLFLCLYFCSQLQSAETKKGKKGPVAAVKTKEGDPMGEIQWMFPELGHCGSVQLSLHSPSGLSIALDLQM